MQTARAYSDPCPRLPGLFSSVRAVRLGLGHGYPRRQAHGLHDHRQFVRRKGDVPAAPARRSVSVRRAGGTRSSRLAGLGLPAGRPLRHARHLRPFRREHRVLFGPGGRQRVPAGRGDGARVLQRLLPRTVLAIEGGLSVRVQHVECGRDQERVLRSRAQPRPRRALAGGRAAPGAHARSASRRKQPRSHAPDLHERARHLRLFLGRAAGARGGDPARPLPASVVDRRRSAAVARIPGSSATSPPSP